MPLEHVAKLTDGFQEVPAYEDAAEVEERFVDAGAPLIADGETTEAVEPGQGPFDDPARAAEATAMVGASLGELGPNASSLQDVAVGL